MNASDLYAYTLEALTSLAFASWRFPFVYEAGLASLFWGACLLAAFLIVCLVGVIAGSDFYLHWAVSAALGIGFVVHGCAALLFGKRVVAKDGPT
jgi:hypothetical protein